MKSVYLLNKDKYNPTTKKCESQNINEFYLTFEEAEQAFEALQLEEYEHKYLYEITVDEKTGRIDKSIFFSESYRPSVYMY